jgi:hypothetical protein
MPRKPMRWFWTDERDLIERLTPAGRRRYAEAVRRYRVRGFRGEPIGETWKQRLETLCRTDARSVPEPNARGQNI